MFVPSRFGSLLDQSRDFLRMGDVDYVAGASDFDFVTLGTCGVPAFQFGLGPAQYRLLGPWAPLGVARPPRPRAANPKNSWAIAARGRHLILQKCCHVECTWSATSGPPKQYESELLSRLCKHRDSGAGNHSRGWRPKAETPGIGTHAVRAPEGRGDRSPHFRGSEARPDFGRAESKHPYWTPSLWVK